MRRALLALLLLALAWPAASAADHVTIAGSITAALRERPGFPGSWIVEARWSLDCIGAPSGATFQGYLFLDDLDTGESSYGILVTGGSGSGDYDFYPETGAQERHVQARLDISCYENATLHGSASEVFKSNVLTIPGRDAEGGSGGGRGGPHGNRPRDPLGAGGCRNVIRGTSRRDAIGGGAGGDLIFGFGKADLLRGRGGHDCLIGGKGGDRLLGGAGRDRLTGGAGRDVLDGGGGRNAYDAGSGDDRLSAANGRSERVRCGTGRDRARVDRGDSVIGCEQVDRA